MKIHDVEINFPYRSGKEFSIKIDGKKFEPTSGIVIKSPCASGEGCSTVQITFYANIKGKIKTDRLKKIQIGEDKG